MLQKIAVIGTGRWGTAVAVYLSHIGLDVTLCSHSHKTAESVRNTRYSPKLPQYSLPVSMPVVCTKDITFETFDTIVVSTPLIYLREMFNDLRGVSDSAIFIGINKGIERESFMVPPQITSEYFPLNAYAQLSGPCFPAGLLEKGNKSAETLACRNYEIGLNLQSRLSSEKLRVYLSRDVDGVAFMGAIKNVYAIAAGFIQALHLNEEATAIMLSRAISEMKKFCRFMFIPDETLYGLSGLGDLLLTCYSSQSSHNKTFGQLFCELKSLEKTSEALNGSVAEGVYTVKALHDLCERFSVEMPIVHTVYNMLYNRQDIRSALTGLMNRPLKIED